jgi:hypothetical protein
MSKYPLGVGWSRAIMMGKLMGCENEIEIVVAGMSSE